MIRRRLTFIFLLATLAAADADSRPPHPDSCPLITISCLSGGGCRSRTYGFAANISGGDTTKEPTFKWSVSAGRIKKGQGTSYIEVDAGDVAVDIEVKVEVGGIQPRGCANPDMASYTTECHSK
jgi:hypothetical protein